MLKQIHPDITNREKLVGKIFTVFALLHDNHAWKGVQEKKFVWEFLRSQWSASNNGSTLFDFAQGSDEVMPWIDSILAKVAEGGDTVYVDNFRSAWQAALDAAAAVTAEDAAKTSAQCESN